MSIPTLVINIFVLSLFFQRNMPSWSKEITMVCTAFGKVHAISKGEVIRALLSVHIIQRFS